MKVYSKNRGCEVIPDKNGVSLESLRNENLSLNDDDGDHNHNELLVVDDEKMMKNLIMFLMSQTLFKLREKFNVTTKATRFNNEKFLNIIRTDQKEHSDAIRKSLKKNYRHSLIILSSLSCYKMLRS